MKKRTLFLWVLFLSIALLCAQGVNFHAHDFGHDNESHHSSIDPNFTVDHSHQSGIHLTMDISHSDDHDDILSELDISSQVVLKKVSSNGPMPIMLMVIFSFLFYQFYVYKFYRSNYDDDLILAWRNFLSPPLRAPPL